MLKIRLIKTLTLLCFSYLVFIVTDFNAWAKPKPSLQNKSDQQAFFTGSDSLIVKFKDSSDAGLVVVELLENDQRFDSLDPDTKLDRFKDKHGIKKIQRIFQNQCATFSSPGRIRGQDIRAFRTEIHRNLTARQNKLHALKAQDTGRRMSPEPSLHLFQGNIYKITTASSSGFSPSALQDLKNDPAVEWAEPNYRFLTSWTPNDPRFGEQWAHAVTLAESGWDVTQGSPSTVIAIVDTGIDYTHEDLAGNIWRDAQNHPGKDFVDIDTQAYVADGYSLVPQEDYTGIDYDPSDYYGHGTHCAGIAAARGNNGIGVIGICPDCRIMPVRAGFGIVHPTYGTVGVLENDDIAQAIIYAADNGADIISMSFGGVSSFLVKEAVEYASGIGVLMFASAGNSNTDTKSYPAAFPEVISVAATTETDAKASYSNYGSWIDICAPGSDILATVPTTGALADPSGYKNLSGTSMACPYVAGLAGLLRSKWPEADLSEISRRLFSGTRDLGTTGWDEYFGFGRVDASLALGENTAYILARITAPAKQQYVNDNIEIIGTAESDNFLGYCIEIAPGASPAPGSWSTQGISLTSNKNTYGLEGILGNLDISMLADGIWSLKLLVVTQDYQSQTNLVTFSIDKSLANGWPKEIWFGANSAPVVGDLDNDGDLEIVTNSYSGIVYAWHHDGALVNGWPQYMNHLGSSESSSPSVADLDNDGDLEIVCGSDDSYHENLYIWQHDGTPVNGWPREYANYFSKTPVIEDLNGSLPFEIIIPGEDWKVHAYFTDATSVDGWPVTISNAQEGSRVVIGDIDNDGKNEVFSADKNSSDSAMYGWQFDGTPLPGWPLLWTGSRTYVKPGALADLDMDGIMEIIASGYRLYALKADGTPLPGWPKELINSYGYRIQFKEPAIADLDGDGQLDIVVAADDDKIHAFRADGSDLPGWPYTFGFYNPAWVNHCLIANIDADEYPEVIVAAYDSYNGIAYIYALNHDGTLVQGFPKIGGSYQSCPVVADLDNDGGRELIAVSMYTGNPNVPIFVWDLPDSNASAPDPWPMLAQNSRHTGVAKKPNHPADIDTDFDVDGNDLSEYCRQADNGTAPLKLQDFCLLFGKKF